MECRCPIGRAFSLPHWRLVSPTLAAPSSRAFFIFLFQHLLVLIKSSTKPSISLLRARVGLRKTQCPECEDGEDDGTRSSPLSAMGTVDLRTRGSTSLHFLSPCRILRINGLTILQHVAQSWADSMPMRPGCASTHLTSGLGSCLQQSNHSLVRHSLSERA